jgi:hypothetical protein
MVHTKSRAYHNRSGVSHKRTLSKKELGSTNRLNDSHQNKLLNSSIAYQSSLASTRWLYSLLHRSLHTDHGNHNEKLNKHQTFFAHPTDSIFCKRSRPNSSSQKNTLFNALALRPCNSCFLPYKLSFEPTLSDALKALLHLSCLHVPFFQLW